MKSALLSQFCDRHLGSSNSSDSTRNTNVTKLEDRLGSLEKQGEEQKEQGRRQEDMLNKIFGELSRLGQSKD